MAKKQNNKNDNPTKKKTKKKRAPKLYSNKKIVIALIERNIVKINKAHEGFPAIKTALIRNELNCALVEKIFPEKITEIFSNLLEETYVDALLKQRHETLKALLKKNKEKENEEND